MRGDYGLVITTLVAGLVAADAAAQTWSNATRLNDWTESTQGAIKKPDVCAAAAGGFHIVYRHHWNYGGVPMRYRRYVGGALGPVITAASPPDYAWDEYICEAGNGDIHISWEDWLSPANTGWTKSTNGGASFIPYQRITNFTGSAKAPRIARYGTGSSPEVMLVVSDPANKKVVYNRYNGTSWLGAANTGLGYDSEYQIFGIAWSPLDGTIWAGNNNVSSTPTLLHYTGSSWTSTDVENTGFFARQSVAVNPTGQVMYCWEKDMVWRSKMFTPGAGWGATQVVSSQGGFGSVIYLPGTNNFYSVYATGSSPLRIRGKLYSGGTWFSEEVISVGLPDAQALDPRVAVATDGSMLCCWEWWGNGNAEAYYSVRSSAPPGQTGTLAGVVRDQYGAGVPNVSVSSSMVATTTGAGGSYSASSPTGTYTVIAAKAYYTGQTTSNVTINQNQTTTVNFTISGQPPAAVSSFTATGQNTSNLLQWTNPTSGQFSATRIVYRTDRAPTGPTDGTQVIEDAATPGSSRSCTHTGLANGVKYYYGAYAYYQDASRFYAGGLNANANPAVKPDLDRDGDVDQADFGLFQVCYSGSLIPQTLPECQYAKMDGDTDVDTDDAAVLVGCLSGSGVPAAVNCAD